MKAHTKTYFKYFNIAFNESGWHDFIACEVCGSESVDIHHTNGRKDNRIESLIALCRDCHDRAHFFCLPYHKLTKESLQEIHNRNLKTVNKN